MAVRSVNKKKTKKPAEKDNARPSGNPDIKERLKTIKEVKAKNVKNPVETDEKISTKRRIELIARRKALGLTQSELAWVIGVNVNTVCSIENNSSYDPRLSLLKKLCEVYDDTIENLFWS